VIRLRLLNASTARVLNFQFSDGRDLILAATDGGLLPQPERMKSLRLSPGERAEVLVPMVAGDSVVLQSRNPPLGDVVPFGGPDGGSDQFDVLQINAATKLDTAGTIPTQLAPMEINGLSMDLRRVDEVVLLGSTEIWSIKNGVAIPHNFHIHDVQFQILDVNGAPPPPSLRGWKDTIYVEPNATYRLIMHFADHSDPDMPYMYHCHLLTHEDAGLMGQFVVVKRGESAGVPRGATHNH
jgi:suppressor of ftsI